MHYDSKIPLLDISFLFFIMLFIPAAAYIDTAIFQNRMSELSLTEISQSSLVLASTVMFYKEAQLSDTLKAPLYLATTLLAMIFIREADYYLDFIYHGSWKVPVFITFCFGMYTVIKNKLPIFSPLALAIKTKAFGYMMCGLAITLIFSRLYGNSTIWLTMLSRSDASYIKNIIQESLELLGYSMIFLGALTQHFSARHNAH